MIAVIIPALNEEEAIGKVIAEIPSSVGQIIVADNGSTDNTAAVARAAGAEVVASPQRGYGAACLSGINALSSNPPEIVVFLDGDYSDYPEELPLLTAPIQANEADMVIGSRVEKAAPGSLTPVQVFGNWLSVTLIRLIWRERFTDLGPFRAITWDALMACEMTDRDFGWTVEMQVRAAKLGLRCRSVSVRYRARVGVSKVSGTVKGSFLAGKKILSVIAVEALKSPRLTRARAGKTARPVG